MLNLISLHDLVLYNVEPCVNFLAVRWLKGSVAGVMHLPALAPSAGLLSFWKSSSQDDEAWAVYEEEFYREMQSASAETALKTIEDLVQHDFTVNIMCYCASNMRCHRRLLAHLLEERNIQVNLA